MNNIESNFVPYQIALDMKSIGFDEPCRDHWERGTDGHGWGLFTSGDSLTYKDLTPEYKDKEGNLCGEFSCPSFSQAFRWFREKYGYDVTIKKCTPSEYKFEIEQLFAEGNNYYFINFLFISYEEAELECLKKLIEIVKEKK